MKQAPLLIVTLEGGLITSVTCENPEVLAQLGNALVVDYDIEGAEPEELFPVRFRDGTMEHAVVHLTEITETDMDTAFMKKRL